ncbi:hypothetical protein CONPUDRAFT_83260 [Coniophora puteana RWD-64-598 SS2]|uniref:Uncharacterized protein n=1 Tax=Coniophora puteana (strain RWD-64-598) TaxID=741705 RepID=A0A5M3MJ27_CONPW|nr:uncharacterized protein CONPUDRAFT_83260 [Coniophora puteana RWD-64-598 SS2]EIW78794.1 hypothetical protein CONPUDRAFT_83260 [Coniophora puteana RWD-64-598 SS2]
MFLNALLSGLTAGLVIPFPEPDPEPELVPELTEAPLVNPAAPPLALRASVGLSQSAVLDFCGADAATADEEDLGTSYDAERAGGAPPSELATRTTGAVKLGAFGTSMSDAPGSPSSFPPPPPLVLFLRPTNEAVDKFFTALPSPPPASPASRVASLACAHPARFRRDTSSTMLIRLVSALPFTLALALGFAGGGIVRAFCARFFALKSDAVFVLVCVAAEALDRIELERFGVPSLVSAGGFGGVGWALDAGAGLGADEDEAGTALACLPATGCTNVSPSTVTLFAFFGAAPVWSVAGADMMLPFDSELLRDTEDPPPTAGFLVDADRERLVVSGSTTTTSVDLALACPATGAFAGDPAC